MQPHGLGETVVRRMAEDRRARDTAFERASDPGPLATGLVDFETVGVAVGGEEDAVGLPVPRPVPPEAESAVVILGQLQRRRGRAGLAGNEVDDEKRLWRGDGLGPDLPGFVQRGLGFRREQVHELVPRDQARARGVAPDLVDGDEFHEALLVAHVPEVRRAALELGMGPRRPDAVVMDVVAREIVGHDAAGRSRDGVDVAAPHEGFLDVGARHFAGLGLVAEHLLHARLEDDLLAVACGGNGWLGGGGGCGDKQAKSEGGKWEAHGGSSVRAAETVKQADWRVVLIVIFLVLLIRLRGRVRIEIRERAVG